MKTPVLVLVAALGAVGSFAATPELSRRWESAASLKVPEAVLYDSARQVLYVTNIEGEPWKKDGRGSVGQVGLDGRVIAVEWVTGLDAPKGMALHGSRLYVGDMDQVVVIDVEAGRIVDRIRPPGAQGLNDVTVDKEGVVYVSDSFAKKLYQVQDGKAELLLENLQGPNGVLAHEGELYLLDGEGLYRVGTDRQLTLLCDGLEGVVDGVESIGGGEFLVSCWRGVLYHVSADGRRSKLMDTRAQEIYSADIDFDPATRTLYVPTFYGNTVVAYDVK